MNDRAVTGLLGTPNLRRHLRLHRQKEALLPSRLRSRMRPHRRLRRGPRRRAVPRQPDPGSVEHLRQVRQRQRAGEPRIGQLRAVAWRTVLGGEPMIQSSGETMNE